MYIEGWKIGHRHGKNGILYFHEGETEKSNGTHFFVFRLDCTLPQALF